MGTHALDAGTSKTQLIGATVISRDHRLVGAVDEYVDNADSGQTVVIGLGGFLGLGEKDVAVPLSRIEVVPSQPKSLARTYGTGEYAGSRPERIIVQMSLEELEKAPAYAARAGSAAGKPSRNSGTPSDVHEKQSPSSTQSGGPG